MKHKIRPPSFAVDGVRLRTQVRRETESLKAGNKSGDMIYNVSGLDTDVCTHNSFSTLIFETSVEACWDSDIQQICNYRHRGPMGGSEQLNIKGE